jgi:LacI family transcriptional regulator
MTSAARRPTQADVARRANVSQAMVSYVMTGNAVITAPAETRQRILAAADELGYVPNRAAQTLRTRRTYTVAGVIPDITNPFYPALERGIQDALEPRGYDLITYNTDGLLVRERSALRSALQGQVDGLIVMPFRLPIEDFLPLLQAQTAVVALGLLPTSVAGFALDSVYVDSQAGARAATAFLASRGHTRIGMIAGQDDTPPSRSRIAGYQQGLIDHQLLFDSTLLRSGAVHDEGGYLAAGELLSLESPPTAILAANDLLAMGALLAAREAGLEVPDDLAVIGFDDIPAARLVWPPLTTVAQFPARIGKRAAEMLLQRLDGAAPEDGQSEEMPYELVIRGST